MEFKLGRVVHTLKSKVQEAEVEEPYVPTQPGLRREETLSHKSAAFVALA